MLLPLPKFTHKLIKGGLYLLLLFGSSNALSTEITLLSTADDNSGTLFSEKLITALSTSQLQVTHLTSSTHYPKVTNQDQLWITIGPKALLQHLSHRPNTPTVALMVTAYQYREIVESSGYAKNITAIFSDPPLQRQINLVQTVLPSAQVIGILGRDAQPTTPVSINRDKATILYMEVDGEINLALQKILSKIDVLITTADSTLYNNRNFRNILLSSYRKRVPMVCHTKATVTAGCISGTFSTQDDLLQHAVGLIQELYLGDEKVLPTPKSIDTFTVATNPRVARSLGFHLRHPDRLKQQILQLKGAMP